jgi:transposase
VILTRKEKASLVIKLAEAGKTTRHIAQVAHVSLKDIGTILRRYTGEDEESPYREKGLSKCPYPCRSSCLDILYFHLL